MCFEKLVYHFTFLFNTRIFWIFKCPDNVAGRLSKNVVMTGNVLLNGKKKGLGAGYGVVVSKVTHFLHIIICGSINIRE